MTIKNVCRHCHVSPGGRSVLFFRTTTLHYAALVEAEVQRCAVSPGNGAQVCHTASKLSLRHRGGDRWSSTKLYSLALWWQILARCSLAAFLAARCDQVTTFQPVRGDMGKFLAVTLKGSVILLFPGLSAWDMDLVSTRSKNLGSQGVPKLPGLFMLKYY